MGKIDYEKAWQELKVYVMAIRSETKGVYGIPSKDDIIKQEGCHIVANEILRRMDRLEKKYR